MSAKPNAQGSDVAPDRAALRDAALAYLARYAATEFSLRRVLQRRIERWARRAAEAADDRDAIAAQTAAAAQTVLIVVSELAAEGLVNDVQFAESRARRLQRSGRSRRAIAAHLAAKGVTDDVLNEVMPAEEGEAELGAALLVAKRRRIGPFRTGDLSDPAGLYRELGILARAGFTQALAREALGLEITEAEDRINRLRR